METPGCSPRAGAPSGADGDPARPRPVCPGRNAARPLQDPPEILLRSWLVIGFLLLYIPTDFQVKMLAGWQVPVGILATRAVFDQVVPSFPGI